MLESKVRVLLIEDTASDALLVKRALAKSELPELEVCHVTDLKSGLDALSSEAFDVVLSDLGLPDSTGTRTISKLRAVNADTPIIVLTGLDAFELIIESIKLGAQDYFVKSRVNTDELIEKMLDMVVHHHLLSDGPFAKAAPLRAGGRVIRLLVLEDNEADFVLTVRKLSAVKLVRFEIVHANTLKAALGLLPEVDIVLSDLSVSDSRGIETLHQLRSKAPNTPIIILSGSDEGYLASSVRESGAQEYLAKDEVNGFLLGQALLRHVKESVAKVD
jgi:DNA-binding NarL/FixJ family response regulator